MRKRLLSASVLVSLIILTALLIKGLDSKAEPLPNPPLRDLAQKHNVEMGNFAILSRLHEKPYHQILTSQFSFVLADNAPNWYFTDGGMRPSANTYNFKQVDEVVKFAQDNSQAVQAHHYLWGDEKWLPGWLKNGNYTPTQLSNLMRDHILSVGQHYKGKIREWTVVNEAFSRQQHLFGLHDWWADHTGGQQYIDNAFTWARRADPSSKLILNDFQNEPINEVSNAMYSYIKSAKVRGVPIDGIGMQMHIDGTHPPMKDEVVTNMKRFGELGIEVYVTEFDVNMNDVKAPPEDKNKIQADIYHDMLRACIESRVCHSFAMLGITDKETWYNHIGLDDPRPLPFDKNYRPKPAWHALRQALQEN